MIVFVVLFIMFMGIIFHISCKKETSCERCADRKNPPIAVAGSDQVITLPTESVLLDGRSSSDPDGRIGEWLWTQISGPASFKIVVFDNDREVQLLVSFLCVGHL